MASSSREEEYYDDDDDDDDDVDPSGVATAAGTPLFSLSTVPVAKKKLGRPNQGLKMFLTEAVSSTTTTDFALQDINMLGHQDEPKADHKIGHCDGIEESGIDTEVGETSDMCLFGAGEYWQRHTQHGLAPAHVLMQPLVELVNTNQTTPIDQSVLTLADKFLGANFHLASSVILEAATKIDRKGQALRLQRLACALYLLQRHHIHELDARIVQSLPAAGKLLYLEHCSYDETPMLTRVQQSPPQEKPEVVHNQCLLPAHLAFLSSLQRGVTMPSLASSAKLLQVKIGTGVLVSVSEKKILLPD